MAIVYYTKTKNTVSASSKSKTISAPESKVSGNSASVASFEEIQDDETPFPAPEQSSIEPEPIPSEISEEIVEIEEFNEPDTHQPIDTSFQSQDYEQSYFNEPKKHNPYASVGINYNSQPTDVNFQFTKREQGEYE